MLSHALPLAQGGARASPSGQQGAGVNFFRSTIVNRIDKKGRVSVPADFRAALISRGSNEFHAKPSEKFACIDSYGNDYVEAILKKARDMDIDSDERREYLHIRFAPLISLSWDAEGRVVLPESLLAHAEISDAVAFVGIGDSFEIWNPARYQEWRAEMLSRTQARQRQGGGA